MLACALRWLFRECFQELDLERKSALTALCWGVWVIAFHTFDSSPAFEYLTAAARWLSGGHGRPEWVWGGLCICVGAAQLHSIFAGFRRTRMAAALFAATLWACLGSAFCLHNPAGTGALVYGFFALANAALYYQVATGRRGERGRFNVRVSLPRGEAQP